MVRRVVVGLVLVVLVGLGWAVLHRLGLDRVGRGAPVPPPAARVADPASRRVLPVAGEVVGFRGRYGSHVWLGLPYAEPPVGERRWRPPEPAPPWEGTREALAFGPHCPQFASPFGGVEGDPNALRGNEDCLYLNVYAPYMEPDQVPGGGARLPVMVWIHGGGNVIGLSDFYDGGHLAEGEKVVVVTFNYRLGPFGWFRHAALRGPEDGPAARSGNFGTLDLVRALEWVRDNIAGFGGDPGRVTVFGESAGGTNVYTLLLTPQASGLFQRAIVESGGLRLTSATEAEAWHEEGGHRRSSNEVIAHLLVDAGKAEDRAAARALVASMPPAELAAWLRQVPPDRLFAAYGREPQELLLDMPRVFADGAVLPAGDPLRALARADGWNRVPVIVGTNRDERKLFQFADPLYVRRWLGIVPRVREPDLYLATADAVSRLWKATGADGPASAMRRQEKRVFVYRFDWDEEPALLGLDLARFLGAAHGFEIPFVFGHWDLGRRGNVIWNAANRPGRKALSAQMASYWTEFAATGDPGRGRRDELPAWQAWDGSSPRYLVLDTDDGAGGGGPRMADGAVREEDVLASVARDPRLRDARERCWVYYALVGRGRDFGPEQYAKAGCEAFPYEQFPWAD